MYLPFVFYVNLLLSLSLPHKEETQRFLLVKIQLLKLNSQKQFLTEIIRICSFDPLYYTGTTNFFPGYVRKYKTKIYDITGFEFPGGSIVVNTKAIHR